MGNISTGAFIIQSGQLSQEIFPLDNVVQFTNTVNVGTTGGGFKLDLLGGTGGGVSVTDLGEMKYQNTTGAFLSASNARELQFGTAASGTVTPVFAIGNALAILNVPMTFSNLATFNAGMTVAVGQSVNTNIIRDNAGNAAEVLATGKVTFSNQFTTAATGLANVATQTTVNGTTAGSIICGEPEQGASYKNVVCFLNGLNGSAVYTFPTAWTHAGNNQTFTGVTMSSTTTQVTISTTGALSGVVSIIGF
jgi:hypothetical protein